MHGIAPQIIAPELPGVAIAERRIGKQHGLERFEQRKCIHRLYSAFFVSVELDLRSAGEESKMRVRMKRHDPRAGVVRSAFEMLQEHAIAAGGDRLDNILPPSRIDAHARECMVEAAEKFLGKGIIAPETPVDDIQVGFRRE